MSKTYNITAENGKSYKLTITSSSNALSLKLQNTSSPSETYEVNNLNLNDLHSLNKIYKQFDNVPKIADVIGKKVENKNFVLKTGQCVLSFKHTNEYDDQELISYVIPQVGGGVSVGGGSNSAELDRLRRENEDLRRQLQNAQGSKPSYTAPTTSAPSYTPSVQPYKPVQPAYKPAAPKPSNQPKPKPATTSSLQEPVVSLSHPGMNPFIPKYPEVKKVDTSVKQECIYNLDRSIAYKSSGDFFTRVNMCLDRIKNLKQILGDIDKKLSDLKYTFDSTINKVFAHEPSQDEKVKCLNLVWQILILYLEFRETSHYEEMFKQELEDTGKTLSPDEQKRFNDACVTFNKRVPFDLAQKSQKMNNTFRQMIKDFFNDKNLRYYKPAEKEEIDHFQHVLMWNSV